VRVPPPATGTGTGTGDADADADGSAEIASQDAVYVLAYSVIMLNTDLHNPQNRVSCSGFAGDAPVLICQKRMTIDDYKRNLRGVNDGKDFDPEYLASIHESIKKREIILPEEHVGQPGFDYAWKSLMQRSRTAGECVTRGSLNARRDDRLQRRRV
jgi:brefeldin A-resistance guanine nucleotide exchange factor 1